MRQMWILEKLKFKIFPGNMPPDPSSVLAPLALHTILAGPTPNSFCRACAFISGFTSTADLCVKAEN